MTDRAGRSLEGVTTTKNVLEEEERDVITPVLKEIYKDLFVADGIRPGQEEK